VSQSGESRESCVERWDRARARFAALDGGLRAVITWIESSRTAAEECDRRAAAGEPLGPLHGLLVGIKDNIDVAGVVTTAGAAFLSENVATADAGCIELLRAQGAVVIAKLNMAELAWGATTQNATYGACRNPWDTDRIPGGSSGGSGAALAARMCEAALGTDTGASVRVPAALNGVVGLRPTFGAISNRGVYPVAYTQDAVGPMAVLASDAARLTEALIQHDPADPYSLAGAVMPATSLIGVPLDGVVFGVPESFFFDDLEQGVADRIDDFMSWLKAQGGQVVPVADFGQAQAFEHWTRIVQSEGASLHEPRLGDSPHHFSPDVHGRVSAGLDVRAVDLVRSLDWRQRYRHGLGQVFAEVDVIVTPVVPIDVPFAEGYDSRAQTQALGRITYPWALHAGPTLTLPIGFNTDSDLPVGVALSAAPWCEARLFQVAAAYQRDTMWHQRLPGLVSALEEAPSE